MRPHHRHAALYIIVVGSGRGNGTYAEHARSSGHMGGYHAGLAGETGQKLGYAQHFGFLLLQFHTNNCQIKSKNFVRTAEHVSSRERTVR